MRTFFVLLFIVSITRLSAQDVVADISLGQPFYPADEGYAGVSLFSKELTRSGYPLSLNFDSPADFLKLHKPAIFLLTPSIFSFHSQADVDALRAYVMQGGNLLIFAEHENFFRSSENLNRFLTGTGIEILFDKVERIGSTHFADRFRPRAKTVYGATDSVIFYFPASLQLVDSTASRAKSADGKVMAAITPFGQGKIGVICDFEIIWNMSARTGLRYGTNRNFVMQFIAELVKPGIPVELKDKPSGKNIWLNAGCYEHVADKPVNVSVLFDAFKKKGYGLRYVKPGMNDNPSEQDVYLGLCACETEAEYQFISKFSRVFMVGFLRSDFFGNIEDKLLEYEQTLGIDVQPIREQITQLVKYDSISFFSWQTRWEKENGLDVRQRISAWDSVYQVKGLVDVDTTFKSPFNLAFNIMVAMAGDRILLWGKSKGGYGYPVPVDNRADLALNTAPERIYPVLLIRDKLVYCSVPGIWQSNFPDKKLQQKLAAEVVAALSK